MIIDNITTLETKYVFIIKLILSHCLYTKEAVTNLPNSNTHPIIIIGIGLAENICANPMIEKYPAIPEIAKAVNNKITAKIILFQI